MPQSFDTFGGARITIDCTEIQCVVPHRSMTNQSATFSHYKQRNSFKGLIGVAPNSAITFVSELYPGSLSDKQIVIHSNFLQKMNPGDLILADKGFLLHDIVPQRVKSKYSTFLHHPTIIYPGGSEGNYANCTCSYPYGTINPET